MESDSFQNYVFENVICKMKPFCLDPNVSHTETWKILPLANDVFKRIWIK